MFQFSICRQLALLVAFWIVGALKLCYAADSPGTANPGRSDDVAFLLSGIRTGHEAISSGEFVATEEIEEVPSEGKRVKVVNKLRGVFVREPGRTRTRQEFSREGMAPLGPFILVETEAGKALWASTGTIFLLPTTHKVMAEQSPMDPLALGFLGPDEIQGRKSFGQFLELVAEHQAKGDVSVHREPTGFTLSIEIPTVAKNLKPGATVTVLRRTIIRPSVLGLVPTRTTASFLDENRKDVRHPSTVDVTWTKRGEVAVPAVVRTYQDLKYLYEERRTITFAWKKVNERISDDEFDYQKLPVPAGTQVIDDRLNRHGVAIGVIGAPNPREIADEVRHRGGFRVNVETVIVINAVGVGVLIVGIIWWRRREGGRVKET